MSGDCIFRFGFISDIQYADIDDAMNFSKTEHRGYRDVLTHTETAISFWNAQEPTPLFIAQLGDLIDGQNSGTYGQGLSLEEPQSKQAFECVISRLIECTAPVYHTVGNHELYNFSWAELKAHGNRKEDQQMIAKEEMYFAFRPVSGWCCIVLNSYAISIMQDEESAGYQEAYRILSRHNKNFLTQGKVDYFEGLEGLERRFVPFNGGLGAEQIAWLRSELNSCVRNREKVLIFVHNPLHPAAASEKNLAFDYDEVLQILHHESGKQVVAVCAGHYHRGGYTRDEHGIHHLTVQSPLTHGECFGYVDVYADRLEIKGQGAHRSHTCWYG